MAKVKIVSKLEKIMFSIYEELYLKATPSANFQELIDNAKVDESGRKYIAFMDYEIDEKTAKEIIEKHSKGLSKLDKKRMNISIMLGCSPKSKI